jgi:hypothetical protein
MRFRVSMLFSTLALIVCSSFTAQASTCNNSTIRGSYAFTIHGTIFLPDGSTLLVDGVAKETFDGKGNERQVDAASTNGVLEAPGWRSGTGTYLVNPDCTGTQTITIPGQPDLHLQFIVAQGGNSIHQTVIDPGAAVTAKGERVSAPTRD